MTEQQIQRKLIKHLEQHGWYVIKLTVTNKTGIPDLVAIKPNKVVFYEVKRPDGKVSKIRAYRHKELKAKGIDVQIYRGENL